jgi:16S rRNA (cytosine967-C5)-methyltransferase
LLREAWALAIETLSWIEMQRLSESLALARTTKQLGVHDADALKLAHLLVYETVRRKNFIDKFMNKALEPRLIEEFDLGVQAFLRLYVYKTRFAKNWAQPDIKEAEHIAKLGRSILGWKTLQPVEPFLGLLLTQKPTAILQGTSDEERVALSTFTPTWFVKYCFRLFGRAESIAILEANLQPPPTYVRINTLRLKENEILERLCQEGVEVEKIQQLQHVYTPQNAQQPLTRTSSYQEGLFCIQDKASCFAAEATNPQPKMTVLDVCAAPGAKTTFMAQLMQNQGTIYSLDYSKRRLQIWKSQVARMDVRNAEPIIVDARRRLPCNVEADIVTLDPPCTSTGTFGRLPSAKWRLTQHSIERMAEFQWQMLNNCAEQVKPKGMLVYSTCSITVEENEMLVERFLKWHLEFSLVDISPRIGLPGLRGMDRCQRLYPHLHGCNGFFIAKLQRE